MGTSNASVEHLEWAVKARFTNQQCSLRLLRLFKAYEDVWKTKLFARAAQDLVAVAFSLWRAAFLANKTGRRSDVFEHGRDFLQKMIEDNAIGYPQDKASGEWTFNFYTRNARASLQILARYWPGVAQPYQGMKRNPVARWEYCQSLFEQNVTGFEVLLRDKATKEASVKAKNARRAQRKSNRTKVRKMMRGDTAS